MVRLNTPAELATTEEELGGLSPTKLGYLRRGGWWLAILFLVTAAVNVVLASNISTALFAGVECFFCWCAIAAVIEYFFLRLRISDLRETPPDHERAPPRHLRPGAASHAKERVAPGLNVNSFARSWQWVIFFGGVLAIAAFVRASLGSAPLNYESVFALRVATVIFLGEGCIVYFFSNFVRAIVQRTGSDALTTLLVLARIAALALFSAAALLFLFLSTTREYTGWLGWALIGVSGILIIETLVRFSLRLYQPASLRGQPMPAGRSLLLETAFGHGQGLGSAARSFETLLGVKLKETWIVGYLRATIELVLLGTVVLGWLSTCFTAVPAGSRAVRVLWGRYQPTALQPGLHVTWPRPIEQIEIVPTENVRQISLGFDKDMSGAVLWTEPHFEGEKNLLVGDGESLLTINVPILYRISDPVRYLETTTDAEKALLALAERKLIRVAGAHGSFEIMTTQRAEIADTLRQSLQAEVSRLGLGLEILFVGLKDVHPPVPVAPAYQEVVSAQEEKEQMIDMARAARARALPNADAEASRLRVQAEAAAQARIADAQGAAARFLAVIQADRENSSLFRLRLKLDAIGSVLGKAKTTILAVPTQGPKGDFYLDLRNSATIPPP
jgi:HflK protein